MSTCSEPLSSCWVGCCPVQDPSNKANEIFEMYSLKFYFVRVYGDICKNPWEDANGTLTILETGRYKGKNQACVPPVLQTAPHGNKELRGTLLVIR